MAAPVVQSLAQVMADLAPVYAPQQAVIQQQQAALPAKYTAQRTALTAEKGQGFNTINDQATGRGLAFSGIPLDEQATYLSTKYLPGMQQLDTQENEDNMTLAGKAADIQSQIGQNAYSTVQSQAKSLTDWQNQQDQNAFTASQADKDRQFQAAQTAASRAADTASQGPSTQDVVNHMKSYVQGKLGHDQKLSPSDFKNGYQDFFAFSGGSYDDYLALMRGYINDSHAKDYIDS